MISLRCLNPYAAAAGLIWPIENDAKNLKKDLDYIAHGYSSESTAPKLSNEYQHDRVQMFFNNLAISSFGQKKPQHWKG